MDNINIKSGDKIKCDYCIYEVDYIEENKYCKGNYGVATTNGYYFSILDVSLVEEK